MPRRFKVRVLWQKPVHRLIVCELQDLGAPQERVTKGHPEGIWGFIGLHIEHSVKARDLQLPIRAARF